MSLEKLKKALEEAYNVKASESLDTVLDEEEFFPCPIADVLELLGMGSKEAAARAAWCGQEIRTLDDIVALADIEFRFAKCPACNRVYGWSPDRYWWVYFPEADQQEPRGVPLGEYGYYQQVCCGGE